MGSCTAGCESQGLQGRVRELGAEGQAAWRVDRGGEARAGLGPGVGRGERGEEPHGAAGVCGQP